MTVNEPVKKPTCGAKTRAKNPDGSVKLCQQTRLGVGGRCKFHGGKTPVGKASPHWKNGRWSKYLPKVQGFKWREALADPELMKLRQHVALNDAMLTSLLAKLPKGGGKEIPELLERRIVNLQDQHRKLIEAEAKRLQALQQTVTLAQFLHVIDVVADLFREFVKDPKDQEEVQRRIRQLLMAEGQPVATEERRIG